MRRCPRPYPFQASIQRERNGHQGDQHHHVLPEVIHKNEMSLAILLTHIWAPLNEIRAENCLHILGQYARYKSLGVNEPTAKKVAGRYIVAIKVSALSVFESFAVCSASLATPSFSILLSSATSFITSKVVRLAISLSRMVSSLRYSSIFNNYPRS